MLITANKTQRGIFGFLNIDMKIKDAKIKEKANSNVDLQIYDGKYTRGP